MRRRPLNRAGPFRDSASSVGARRDDLIRLRRDQYVEMPEGIQRVFVSRMARAIAGLALCVGGALYLAAATSEQVPLSFEPLFPGPLPAVLSDLQADLTRQLPLK